MLIQLTDNALNTILAKSLEPGLPDIEFFKRPITLEFKNIITTTSAFEKSFLQYFEASAAQKIAEELKKEPLHLMITSESERVRLKLFQKRDLHILAPSFFKAPTEIEFLYLDVSLGKTFIINHCTLANDKEKVLGLAQIFILIAYDTLNHLKSPRESILKTNDTVKRYKIKASPDEYVNFQMKKKKSVYYFYSRQYIYEKRVVDHISTRPINRSLEPRFYLIPEYERRGHWRTYRDKNTGEIKKRTWIEKQQIKIPEDKLKQNQPRVIRITSMK